jgi:outer membrane receptor protein involved in Fe transport
MIPRFRSHPSNCLFIIFLFLFSHFALAQDTGRIEGRVLSKGKPMAYASVSMFLVRDTAHARYSAITDSTGSFLIEQAAFNEYQLTCSMIGYRTAAQSITLTAAHPIASLGNIELVPDQNLLQTVVVSAQKKLIEKTPQGFVVNAGANLTATGGTATDLLKNTPTVAVDAEGGITLRGKTPLIYINGRISNLTNMDQIPASSIETIEIINQPTAKYDANAEAGIINIILKKNRQNGTNGAIALGAGMGSRGRINSAALLNHKTSSWNLGLAYDNRFAGRTRTIDASRTNFDLPDAYLLNQGRNDRRLEQTQNLKFNADFTPDARNSFSFEAIGNLEGQDNNESLNSALYQQNSTLKANTNRHSIELERSRVAEFALDYHRKYADKRKSLTASINTSINRDRENTHISSQSLDSANAGLGNYWYQRTHNYENGNISAATLDYAFPVSAHGQVETGYKALYRTLHADFQSADLVDNDYVINPAASNIFTFNELVQAAYIQFNSAFGKGSSPNWKYDAGLRAEQVLNDGATQGNGTKFSNSYVKLFPTASLAYYVQPDEYWKISYGKRINRPGLGQLNPFTDITDSLNPHSGNPHLQPEIIHAVELGYSKEWERYGLSANLFYRYSLNSIRQYAALQPNGANLSYPVNIGSAVTYGLENIFTARSARFYELNASLSLFQQKLNGSNIATDAVQSAFGWYGKLINNFIPWQNGKLQLTGNYNSSLATPQGRRIAQYFADLGFQQKLGKRNARLGLTITDLFNTFRSGYENQTKEFVNYRYAKADTRSFIVTFAYFFKSAYKEKLLENKFSTEY